MAYALNNVATQDRYTDAATLVCPGSIKLDISISNAAVYYQYATPVHGVAPAGEPFGEELFRPPGFFFLNRKCVAIRFRSAVAGKPAQVTVEAPLPHDVR